MIADTSSPHSSESFEKFCAGSFALSFARNCSLRYAIALAFASAPGAHSGKTFLIFSQHVLVLLDHLIAQLYLEADSTELSVVARFRVSI